MSQLGVPMSSTVTPSTMHGSHRARHDHMRYQEPHDTHSVSHDVPTSEPHSYQPSPFLSDPASAMSMLQLDYSMTTWAHAGYPHATNSFLHVRPYENDYYHPGAAVTQDHLPAQHGYDVQPSHLNTLEPPALFQYPTQAAFDGSSIYYPHVPETMGCDQEMCIFETMPSTPTVSTPYDQSFASETGFSPASTHAVLSTPTSRCTEDEDADDPTDKPYARLIYEALMQAPGHRMMLRDIYEWFAQNTNKPRESGSNGWQNSIRHNLSMNQAFENDKSETPTRGQPRKANSMWLLTEHAVKNGVQSTTRYRKSGASKKHSNNGTAAATTRQKSGSKGGKAARRAALLRRQEGQSRDRVSFEPASTITSPYGHGIELCTSPYNYRPPTPADNMLYGHMYGLPPTSTFQPRLFKDDHEPLGDDAELNDFVGDVMHDDLPKLAPHSPSLGPMFA